MASGSRPRSSRHVQNKDDVPHYEPERYYKKNVQTISNSRFDDRDKGCRKRDIVYYRDSRRQSSDSSPEEDQDSSVSSTQNVTRHHHKRTRKESGYHDEQEHSTKEVKRKYNPHEAVDNGNGDASRLSALEKKTDEINVEEDDNDDSREMNYPNSENEGNEEEDEAGVTEGDQERDGIGEYTTMEDEENEKDASNDSSTSSQKTKKYTESSSKLLKKNKSKPKVKVVDDSSDSENGPDGCLPSFPKRQHNLRISDFDISSPLFIKLDNDQKLVHLNSLLPMDCKQPKNKSDKCDKALSKKIRELQKTCNRARSDIIDTFSLVKPKLIQSKSLKKASHQVKDNTDGEQNVIPDSFESYTDVAKRFVAMQNKTETDYVSSSALKTSTSVFVKILNFTVYLLAVLGKVDNTPCLMNGNEIVKVYKDISKMYELPAVTEDFAGLKKLKLGLSYFFTIITSSMLNALESFGMYKTRKYQLPDLATVFAFYKTHMGEQSVLKMKTHLPALFETHYVEMVSVCNRVWWANEGNAVYSPEALGIVLDTEAVSKYILRPFLRKTVCKALTTMLNEIGLSLFRMFGLSNSFVFDWQSFKYFVMSNSTSMNLLVKQSIVTADILVDLETNGFRETSNNALRVNAFISKIVFDSRTFVYEMFLADPLSLKLYDEFHYDRVPDTLQCILQAENKFTDSQKRLEKDHWYWFLLFAHISELWKKEASSTKRVLFKK